MQELLSKPSWHPLIPAIIQHIGVVLSFSSKEPQYSCTFAGIFSKACYRSKIPALLQQSSQNHAIARDSCNNAATFVETSRHPLIPAIIQQIGAVLSFRSKEPQYSCTFAAIFSKACYRSKIPALLQQSS
ncbi:hypothetical protein [Paenibacillus glycinis]|uniref:Uncharacterized protein n=1 Tax=Paenibacillus glycinis TaxID=2697035 RepID=A0ABW9XPW4_9BACL|nr:hypothetical protein [Paenibacillus glycinis]NBD24673.1 hypothetical protein [Paenibacillus glycinis]